MVASKLECEAISMRKIFIGIFSYGMEPTLNPCDN